MTNLKCYNITCKYYDSYGCKKKNVTLRYHQVNTSYQGNQVYLKCASFKISKEYEEMCKVVEEVLKEVKK